MLDFVLSEEGLHLLNLHDLLQQDLLVAGVGPYLLLLDLDRLEDVLEVVGEVLADRFSGQGNRTTKGFCHTRTDIHDAVFLDLLSRLPLLSELVEHSRVHRQIFLASRIAHELAERIQPLFELLDALLVGSIVFLQWCRAHLQQL